MGNVTSSTNTLEVFNTNVANSLTESMTTIAQGGAQQGIGSQVLKIGDIKACGGGNITISGVNQTNISTFNFAQLANSSSSQDMQTAIKSSIVAASEQNQKVANELGAIGNVSLTDQSQTVFSENVSNIAAKVSTTQIQNIAQTQQSNQETDILNLNTTCSPVYGSGNVQSGGDITISDINQTIRIDLVASQVAELVSEQVVKALGDASVDAFSSNSSEATNTGFATLLSAWFSGITGIIVTIIIVFVLLIAVIVVPVVLLKRKRKRTAAQAQQAQVSAREAAPAAPAPSVQEVANNPQVQQGVKKAIGFIQEVAKNPQVQQGFKKATGFIGNLFKK